MKLQYIEEQVHLWQATCIQPEEVYLSKAVKGLTIRDLFF